MRGLVRSARQYWTYPSDANGIDLSTSTMESALRPLAEHLTCEQCQDSLRERIKNLVVQWSVIKVRRRTCGKDTAMSYIFPANDMT